MTRLKGLKYNVMLWLMPLLLMLPNVWLDATAMDMPVPIKIANIALPLGVYLLLMTVTRRTWWVVLAFFPLMLLNAFQIVLFFLYGGGIIAVDMFLNVVTTSMSEATELLDSLLVAIGVVLAIYLPPLVWCVVCACKKPFWAPTFKAVRVTGTALALAGAVFAAVGYTPLLSRQIYPVNICCNLVEAFSRFHRTGDYGATSAAFTHHATITHPRGEKEAYVLVVGETSRAGNWQLMGYGRPTTPNLSKRDDIMAYPRTLSESNTTHKSVPMIMSHLDSRSFGDSVYVSKGIINAFNEAGFHTVFLSAQKRNHSFVDFFGEQADEHRFIVEMGEEQIDGSLIENFHECLDTVFEKHDKLFMVIHTYGSHFNYRDRYPASDEYFQPANYLNASPDNREELLNAYDNTIRYTDAFLASVIDRLDSTGYDAAMVYLSDHGEDIFDDSRKRFLHASPTPTYYQLHVPLVIWASGTYAEEYPEKVAAARSHEGRKVSSTRAAFHTLLDLAGIKTPYFDSSESLASTMYREAPWTYINDYNESVSLEKSGLTAEDMRLINAM